MTEKLEAPLWENSLQQFRNRVAERTPTPGGGAVAAVTAVFAAALLRMVCSISSTRKADAGMNAIAAKVKICEEQLAEYAEEDIRIFDLYMAARKGRGASADDDMQRCLLACTEVPLAAAEAVVKMEVYAAKMAPNIAEFLSSDLETARHLLCASRKALLANVDTNLKEMEDGEAKRAVLRRLDVLHCNINRAG